jgi:hypothetical protein
MSETLPNRDELFWASVKWTMVRRGGYTGYDLKEYLTGHFQLTEEQLALTRSDGTNRFNNLVDWVTAEFTSAYMHAGWDGGEHRTPDHLYFLTKYGYSVGEGKAAKPTAHRHGARNAKPDIRQLTEEQIRLAPWLKDEMACANKIDAILTIHAARRAKCPR